MKKIRVLQIGLGTKQGGIESCVVNYFSNIDRKRFSFDFADIFGDGIAYTEKIIELGGNIITIGNCKKDPIRTALNLKNIIISGRYDIVHIHVLSAVNLLPVFVSLFTRRCYVIVHSHNSFMPSGITRRIINCINMPILRCLNVNKWACSLKAGNWLWGKEFDKRNVIFNAVDLNKFVNCKSSRIQTRKELGYRKNDIVMGYVGRLIEQKNPFFLLEIVKELHKIDNNFKLLVVGDGPLSTEFEKRIGKYELNNVVFCVGRDRDVLKWYQAMDLFLLPSLFEGLPMVGIEAQAIGLKCFFSSYITHEADITGDSVFLEIDRGEIWRDHIMEYIYSEKVIQNKKKIPQNYDIRYAAKLLENKYQKVMSEKHLH